jgi:hypothetical protein
MMSLLKIVLIWFGFICIVSALVSCENLKTDNLSVDFESKKSEQEEQAYSDSNPLSPQIRNGNQWADINPFLSVLGKSAQEIMDTQISSYFYYMIGREDFLINDSARLHFSDTVWASESKCVAICIPPTWLTGKTGLDGDVKISDVEAKIGIVPEHCDQNGTLYFRYNFEDMEIRIFTKTDGKTLYGDSDTEHYTIIIASGAEFEMTTHADTEESIINAKDIRHRPEWKKADWYISQTGKTLTEIELMLGYALGVNYDAGGNYCVDPNTYIGYRFDDLGVCDWVWGSPSQMLPYENGPMTGNELLSYWGNVNYMRCSYEGYDYVFKFEDVSVTIYGTTREGNLTDDSVIDIKRR